MAPASDCGQHTENRSIEMSAVKVIVGTAAQVGSQMCHLGPTVLTTSKVKLGSPCKIVCPGGVCFLCHAWPRRDKCDKFVELDPVVCSSYKGQLSVCDASIGPVEVGEPQQLHLLVVVDNHSLVVKHKHDPSVQSKLKKWVRNIIRNMTLSPGYTVRSHMMELGQLYGVPFIVVNGATGGGLQVEYFMVKESTKIIIDRVVSKDRFQQQCDWSKTQLGGLGGPLQSLRSVAELAFFKGDQLRHLGIDVARGVLLRGPPGCGKTSLVQMLAQEFDAHLISLDAGSVTGSRPGESEQTLRTTFQRATQMSGEGPCIVLLEEVDALCPGKGSGSQEGRVVSQLVTLLDGLESHNGVLVIGTTNRPSAVDTSLRRPGRLEKEIFIGIPSQQQREQILSVLTANTKLSPNVSLPELAESTPGYVGADLLALVQRALCFSYTDKLKDVGVSARHIEAALHDITPSTQRGSDILVEHSPVSWADIGGLQQVKAQIQQAVEWPLKHPEAFSRLGIQRPRGVLLYGPPGCAKTQLARAAATACHVTFLAISGAQLYSPFVGDSERKISEVFQQARAGAPSILFIDEIDSVIGSRSQHCKQSGVQQRVLSTLLNEMDGVGLKLADVQRSTQLVAAGNTAAGHSHQQLAGSSEKVDNNDVLVVAATNRPDMLDDALIRPGRFDRIIYVPPPDEQGRLQILQVHTKKMPLEGVDLSAIADATDGYTGADLENLCREAALERLSSGGLNATTVRHQDFLSVLTRLGPSLTPGQLQQYTSVKYTHP